MNPNTKLLPPPRAAANAVTLRQFAKRWRLMGHTLQFFALFCYMVASPLRAGYEPSTTAGAEGQPVWVGEDTEPPEGADTSDYDGDGLAAWYEAYIGTDPTLVDTDGTSSRMAMKLSPPLPTHFYGTATVTASPTWMTTMPW